MVSKLRRLGSVTIAVRRASGATFEDTVSLRGSARAIGQLSCGSASPRASSAARYAGTVSQWRSELQRIQSNMETNIEFVGRDRRRMEAAAARGDADDAQFWKDSMIHYARLALGVVEEGIAHMDRVPAGATRADLDRRFGSFRRDLEAIAAAYRTEIARLENTPRERERRRRRQAALDELLRDPR